LTISTLVAATLRGAPFDKMIASSAATILGVLYVVLPGGHLVALRTGFDEQLSAHLLSFFFLVLMGSDTGAYYVGRAIGKHKLAPSIGWIACSSTRRSSTILLTSISAHVTKTNDYEKNNYHRGFHRDCAGFDGSAFRRRHRRLRLLQNR